MRRRFRRIPLLWGVVLAIGCSSGGGGGCGGLGGGGCAAPIPGGFPLDQRIPNAITARMSPAGLQYFQQNLTNLISLVNAGGLNINVPCIQQQQSFSVAGIGVNPTVYACDIPNRYSCSGTSGGPGPVGSNGYAQCTAQAAIQSATITPSNAADGSVNVQVSLQMTVNTGDIPVDVQVPLGFLGTVNANCRVSYDTGNSSFPVNVTMNLKVDPNWGNILGFNIMGIDLSSLVNSSDLSIHANGGGLVSQVCSVLDIGFIKSAVVNLATGLIQSKVSGIIDSFRCQSCDSSGGCPTSPNDPSIVSTCDSSSNLCYVDAANHVCPPKPLGLEGRVNVGSFLSSFGGSPDAALDLYAVAGGVNSDGSPTTTTDAAGGLVIGIMGGTQAPSQSPCVPQAAPFTYSTPDPIDFDAAAMEPGLDPIASYHMGLGVAGAFLNKSLYDVYTSGTMCLNVDSSTSSFLSSSLFTSFLPSLGLLTHGQNVPLLIALRPHAPPTIRIGEGTTTMMNGNVVPLDPLLTISMQKLQLDFYAFIEERYVRLFSLQTDLSLPLSLNFDPVAGTVQPVLAGLDMALTNTQATNSEILAEDPSVLASLLPKLIGLVQPLLGSVLKPIALPTFSGLQLQVQSARGAVQDSSGAYEHLALYASLNIPSQPDSSGVETDARIMDSFIPPVAQVRLGKASPYVLIQANGAGARSLHFAGYEYSYRVDGGLWTQFFPNNPIKVTSPILALQGRHEIQVVAREIGSPTTVDQTPVTIPFIVDYDPPTVHLEEDASAGVIKTIAEDSVWAASDLSYRYKIGAGDWSAPGAVRDISLSTLGEQPWLQVEVTDGSGHVATASYGSEPLNVAKKTGAAGSSTPKASFGCSQSSAPGLALMILGLWLVVRRQRRA